MQTIDLPAVALSLPSGSTVVMKPQSYVEGEPMVTYATDAMSFSLPQRAVVGENFLAVQMVQSTRDVSTAAGGNINVRLEDPVFQDPYMFSLILDYMNRRLDKPATLRQTNPRMSIAQWKKLNAIERFVFYKCDQNPFWTGMTGQDFRVTGGVCNKWISNPTFNLRVQPDELTVEGPGDFSLGIDLKSLTNPVSRPVSLLAGTRSGWFPYYVDFKEYFFIPHTAIRCMIKGEHTVCEGVLRTNGDVRIDPIDTQAFSWFHFEIRTHDVYPVDILYGDP
jgi:hypothetical protein